MQPDSSVVSSLVSGPMLVKQIVEIVGILVGLVGVIATYLTKIKPWLQTKRDRRSLKKRFGAELYTAGIIENSTRYYIEPFCQSLDPAGSEEPRLVYGVKQNLFEAIDDALSNPTEYRYVFLLADSGMGKSSFLINYYARNLRKRRRKFDLHLLPLGIPDADKRIERIENKKDAVLFLDALDEDTLAIVDHVERLRILLDLTREFAKVLITCRTQFFPKEEEIPQQTGIVKVGPKKAGEKAEYVFHKLYLSPFTDEQVQTYLRKRYPVTQRKRYRIAREIVQKIPNLSIRPMLLAHVDDLVTTERHINYAFELYEEMVEAWLTREEGIVPGLKKDPLREFSERLAVDLYANRETRGAEHILKDELAVLAEEWQIPLDDWQLTSRSLLNRDAIGNYKFAHRSIMEYLFVRRFLELSTNMRRKLKWTDQMKMFVCDILRDALNESGGITLNLAKVDLSDLREPVYSFRSRRSVLSAKEVGTMIAKHDFFCSSHEWTKSWQNPSGKGIHHLYEVTNDGKVVHDALTGLQWQQSGSYNTIYSQAEKYIEKLNQDKLAGYSDWRLPTLEEAMTLLEPQRNGKLYIDEIFDKTQEWIWTSVKLDASSVWMVYFDYGSCVNNHVNSRYFVRAVR